MIAAGLVVADLVALGACFFRVLAAICFGAGVGVGTTRGLVERGSGVGLPITMTFGCALLEVCGTGTGLILNPSCIGVGVGTGLFVTGAGVGVGVGFVLPETLAIRLSAAERIVELCGVGVTTGCAPATDTPRRASGNTGINASLPPPRNGRASIRGETGSVELVLAGSVTAGIPDDDPAAAVAGGSGLITGAPSIVAGLS